jgi:cystathionine beta-lyase/cystathionine gamma-synthase
MTTTEEGPTPAPDVRPAPRGFTTRAIHDGTESHAIAEEPVGQPIWLTADYLYESLEHYADVMNDRRPGYVYGRTSNPTNVALHRVLASLEGAEAALSFASGMGALHSTLTALVESGGHVIAQRTVYGGTFELLHAILPGYGIRTSFVDATMEAVSAAIGPETCAVLVETVANPTFRVTDVPAVAAACADAGVPLVVDNTVATPYLFRPLEVPGVTAVMHSTSKYIGGHSDLIGGSVAGSGEIIDRIRHMRLDQGTNDGTFDAWLALRGVQTLALRVERQCANAERVAAMLDSHPKVAEVGYSGLPNHPDHELAAKLFDGPRFGAMLSFSLRGGYSAASAACRELRVARVGSSFGGLHTEVCHPATTSHRQLSPEDLAAAGIGDGLIRVSVGAEDADDLIEDFDRALGTA